MQVWRSKPDAVLNVCNFYNYTTLVASCCMNSIEYTARDEPDDGLKATIHTGSTPEKFSYYPCPQLCYNSRMLLQNLVFTKIQEHTVSFLADIFTRLGLICNFLELIATFNLLCSMLVSLVVWQLYLCNRGATIHDLGVLIYCRFCI